MPAYPLIGSAAHIVSAFLFAALALWAAVRRGEGGRLQRGLAGAALVTLLWSASVAVHGDAASLSAVLESLRNGAWLFFMLLLFLGGPRDARQRAVVSLYVVLALVVAGEIALQGVALALPPEERLTGPVAFAAVVLRMTVAVGALVLVHNLYTAAAPDVRWGLRLPAVALAVMWGYDLNLYTIVYLTGSPVQMLFALRGLLMVPLAGMIALGNRRNPRWTMRVSRAVTFQTLSLMAIGGYLIAMVLIVHALRFAGLGNVQLAQITVITGMSMIGVVLLPSNRLRAWLRVKLIKHFFKHRYDYRTEWLRFTDTLGRAGPDAAALDERVVKAIADITESPGGLLLTPDESGLLVLAARWNAADVVVPAVAGDIVFAGACEQTGWIIEVDSVRRGARTQARAVVPPEWMTANLQVWAAVPLLHFGRLTGIVVLERPPVGRMLDWEDFDLLRLAGRQAASYLAEAHSQDALSEAKRFDEFNRRFAFIMHDIKNLVSQLALVARNAERHADNPAFRADMVATLQASVSKLNELLARLSHHNRARVDEPRPVALRPLVEALARSRSATHPVDVLPGIEASALVDPIRLDQALTHLVQNAIDASGGGEAISLAVSERDGEVVLSVIDRGRGMSPEFVRTRLFRPFASTKRDGFGIGAFEARSLIAAMGGRLEVQSQEGRGSRFDIILRQADGPAEATNRKAAS